jgi:hypothetical protein
VATDDFDEDFGDEEESADDLELADEDEELDDLDDFGEADEELAADDGADDATDDDAADDEEDDEDLEDDEQEDDDDEDEESLDALLALEQGLDDDDLVRLDDEPRDGLTSVSDPIGAGEFTCRSCFLVKRRAQLADERKLICLDCA